MERNKSQVNMHNRYVSFDINNIGSDNQITLQVKGLTNTSHYDNLLQELLDAHIEYN